MKMRLLAFTLALPGMVLASACGDSGEDPAVRSRREAAYRQACAATVLAERAESDFETMNLALLSSDDFTRMATAVAMDFNRAYLRHAEIRRSAYAHQDSAVNHASSSADSAAYAQRALSFSIAVPDEGTLEANVITNYDANLRALLLDPNHACNWDFPF